MSTLGFNEILKRLEYFCAYQERCEFDVNEKITKLGVTSPEENDKFLRLLKKENFLNQERFVSSYINGKVSIKKWGVNKIRLGLTQKKVSPSLIETGLSQINKEVYLNNMAILLSKKAVNLPEYKTDFTQKTKVLRFLSSKGYTAEEIYGLLSI